MSKIDDLIKYYNWISDPDPEWSGPATADYDTLKEEIENELNVLEIIKNKKVVIDWTHNGILIYCEDLTVEEKTIIKTIMKKWIESEE